MATGDQDAATAVAAAMNGEDTTEGTSENNFATSPLMEDEAKPSSSFGALLEMANSIRKEDNNMNDGGMTEPAVAGDDGHGVSQTAIQQSNKPAAPSSGRPAYSAATVAAISSLTSGESPLLVDTVNSGGDSTNNSGNRPNKEITLEDRASAMISVYKDYLDEVNDDDHDDDAVDTHDDGGSIELNQDENTVEKVLSMASAKSEEDSHDNSFYRDLLHNTLATKHNNNRTVNYVHERRKENSKVAILDKFCKDVEEGHITLNGDGGGGRYYSDKDDDSDEDEYEDSFTRYYDDEGGSTLGGYSKKSSSLSSKKKKKAFTSKPTAASTTAAFRLKAEVALKSAATKTKTVAKNAAVAVKTKYKDKTTSPSQLVEKMGRGVENDYDFANYDEGVVDGDGGGSGGEDTRFLSNKSKKEFDEDMEYGIPSSSDQLQNGGGGIYGMHMLQRDDEIKNLKRKGRLNDADTDSMQRFSDICDELGVTPQSHSNLHSFYQRDRSSRYVHPFFRSKKCKRAMLYGAICLGFAALVVSLMSAVTNGFKDLQRSKPLPDWAEDENWREKQKEDWEMEHNNGGGIGIVSGQMPNSSSETADDAIAAANQLEQLFYKVSSAYRPIWYDRTTGWSGQTYQEAVTWCEAYNNYIPCPYEVYCPNQKTLMAGLFEREGESWAAVVNQENEWVQVGTGGVCQLYSEKYGQKPEWGVTGQNNEAMTRHIMCCRAHALQHDEVAGNEEQESEQYVIKATNPPASIDEHDEEVDLNFQMLELSLTQTYNPTWFDRETGWKGQTYEESKDFCNKLNGYIPCPYIVYCPGFGDKVLGGRRDDGESWAAVIDEENEWVQVGAGGECNLYSATEGEKPVWGLTGQNNEEITRHIMCCQYQKEEGEDDLAVTPGTEAGVNEIDESALPIKEEEPETPTEQVSSMTMLEISTQEAFHPEWFDNSLGWSGGSYTDAKAFCESLPQPNGGHWYLCPNMAYCPNGPKEVEPLYLQKDAFEDMQWAPISDKQNGWVMVGKMSQSRPKTCEGYFQINHHDPLWGLDGSSKDMKQHILCCNTPSGIYLSEGDEGDNSGQTTSAAAKPSHDESVLLGAFTPRWYGEKDGWNMGSHDDAIEFCEQHDGIHGIKMELCPYAAYCPEGPGKPPIGGHNIDVIAEGPQWAPLFGNANHWVSISGDKPCQSHWEVHGEEPIWGLDASNPGVKRHVLCCSPLP